MFVTSIMENKIVGNPLTEFVFCFRVALPFQLCYTLFRKWYPGGNLKLRPKFRRRKFKLVDFAGKIQ